MSRDRHCAEIIRNSRFCGCFSVWFWIFRFRKSPTAITALGLLHPDRMYDSLNELPDLEQNMSRKTHLFRVHFYAVLSDFRNQTLRFFHLL